MQEVLAIDVGNSSSKLARYQVSPAGVDLISVRGVANDGDWRTEIAREQPSGWVSIGSVVSGSAKSIAEAAGRVVTADRVAIQTSTSLGPMVRCDPPEAVGVDRVAAVLGASLFFNSPVITVDFGTAITIDAGDSRQFLGGFILPGPTMMFRAMHDYTSALPLLNWDASDTSPLTLGRSTAAAMQTGVRSLVRHGVAEAALALRAEVAGELGCGTDDVVVVRTGGAVVPFGVGERTLPDAVTRGLAIAATRELHY